MSSAALLETYLFPDERQWCTAIRLERQVAQLTVEVPRVSLRPVPRLIAITLYADPAHQNALLPCDFDVMLASAS